MAPEPAVDAASGTVSAGADRAAARLAGVTVHAPGRADPLIAEVSLTLGSGERMLVVGPSGSGKSSLLQVLTGVIPFSQNLELTGEVHLDGVDVSDQPVVQRSRWLGVVAQDPSAAVCLARVDEEVALPLENHGVAPGQISRRIDEALARADAGALRERATGSLSGGEVQRVALAAALAARAAVLLLDEPTSMLDPAGVRAVRRAVDALVEGRTAVLLVEHRLDEIAGADGARGLPERTVALDAQGRVLASGPTEQVLCEHAGTLHDGGCWLPLESELLAITGHPGGLGSPDVRAWLREQSLAVPDAAVADPLVSESATVAAPGGGAADPLPSVSGTVASAGAADPLVSPTVPGAGVADPLVLESASGAPHGDGRSDAAARDGCGDRAGGPHGGPNRVEVLLSARALVVGRPVVGARASRRFGGRRRAAVVEPVLSGVDLELRAGEVVALLGANGSGKSSLLLTLAGLLPAGGGSVAGTRPSMVFQNPELQFLAYRVRDEIAVGLVGDPRRIAEIVDRQLRRHRLEHVADLEPHRLSGGEKRRLSLAAMLAHDDRPVLLADEPAFGLDRRDTVATAAVFHREAAAGRAVLFSSHDLRFVAAVADRVIVLADGAVVADGPTLAVLRDAAVLRRAGLELPPLVAWLLAEAVAEAAAAAEAEAEAAADSNAGADAADADAESDAEAGADPRGAVRVLRLLYAAGSTSPAVIAADNPGARTPCHPEAARDHHPSAPTARPPESTPFPPCTEALR
ncbi:ATP-binding cassette domain-containing protein [Herbiconiux sp. YIM B11900]|uniref:ATP-binding cassette domain-containing protein n=1 Tax=Herbiconiux sp. YIM B11900 TaxID=3404131 RepID=UPI003F85E116